MKFPRTFSLRALLIAFAALSAVLAWLSYEARRGWTVEKVQQLIDRELDPNWDYKSFERWVRSKGFQDYGCGWDGPKDIPITAIRAFKVEGANLGLFNGAGVIHAHFYYVGSDYVMHRLFKESKESYSQWK
jgi:hypothetical protein